MKMIRDKVASPQNRSDTALAYCRSTFSFDA